MTSPEPRCGARCVSPHCLLAHACSAGPPPCIGVALQGVIQIPTRLPSPAGTPKDLTRVTKLPLLLLFGMQMVVTLKLIAAAVCYQDGLRLAAKKSKGEGAGGAIAPAATSGVAAATAGASPAAAAAAPVAAADKAASGVEGAKQEAGRSSSAAGASGLAAGHESPLQGYVRRHALERLPSPLEFLSYVFAAGNLLAGPFFEIRDYLDYVERRVSGRVGGRGDGVYGCLGRTVKVCVVWC